MTLELSVTGPEQTLEVGEALGAAVQPGQVVALEGPLGAGKTVLAKGVAKGLGVPGWRYVTSPTFVIHNLYRGRLTLHHLDLYRLSHRDELEGLGLEEALYGFDVCVIEWPDIFLEELPSDRLLIRFRLEDEERRVLQVEAGGTRSEALCGELRAVLCRTTAREEGA